MQLLKNIQVELGRQIRHFFTVEMSCTAWLALYGAEGRAGFYSCPLDI